MSSAQPGAVDRLEDLPVGRPPALGYVIGHTYHAPDGGTVRLPRRWGTTSITRLGAGFLVTDDRHFEGSNGVYRLDAQGRIIPSAGQPGHLTGAATMSGHPLLSGDGETVHWLTFTPPETGLVLPTLLHEGAVATGAVRTREVDLAPTFLTEVVGRIGDRTVIRSGWGRTGEAWISSADGVTRAPVLDRAELFAPHGRLVAIGLDRDSLGVVDYDAREVLWRRRHVYGLAFSPSGRRLLIADRDRIAVAAARTGASLHEVDPPPYSRGGWRPDQLVWEDERHLLAGVVREHWAAVVRIDVVSGDVERTVDWTPRDPTSYAGVTFAMPR